jgi:signal transduction histidine kinase
MSEHTPDLQARERAVVAEVLTSILRHDLRNRFSSIRNASYYLMRQAQKAEMWKADPRVEAFFQLINRELASAEELLSARGGMGPVEQGGPLRLWEVAERALSRVRVPASIRVERAWVEGDLIEADGESVTLLARCLIENAVEAMPGGGTLEVRTLPGKEGRVLLEVADTGPGVPEAQRARVFEPFMTTKPGHAGLGLCIVQRLALRGGAWVELRANEPVGTCVTVSFHRLEAGAPQGA